MDRPCRHCLERPIHGQQDRCTTGRALTRTLGRNKSGSKGKAREREATGTKNRVESLDPFLPTFSVHLSCSLQVFLFLQLLKYFQHLLLEPQGGMQRLFFFKTKTTTNLSFVLFLSRDTWLLRPGWSVPLLLARLSCQPQLGGRGVPLLILHSKSTLPT